MEWFIGTMVGDSLTADWFSSTGGGGAATTPCTCFLTSGSRPGSAGLIMKLSLGLNFNFSFYLPLSPPSLFASSAPLLSVVSSLISLFWVCNFRNEKHENSNKTEGLKQLLSFFSLGLAQRRYSLQAVILVTQSPLVNFRCTECLSPLVLYLYWSWVRGKTLYATHEL